jgi:DNA-binding NarL/FixJ family response regulator
VLADDAVLIREGLRRVLVERGVDVIAETGDPDELLALVADLQPDLAVVDIRMPPTHTNEGLLAANAIRSRHPRTATLVLSQIRRDRLRAQARRSARPSRLPAQ